MIRRLTLAAIACAALASPTIATAAGVYYAATPAATPTQTTLIASGAVWKWNATAYFAEKGSERDPIVCATVARSTGKLAAFSAGGKPFDADALAKCNAHAK